MSTVDSRLTISQALETIHSEGTDIAGTPWHLSARCPVSGGHLAPFTSHHINRLIDFIVVLLSRLHEDFVRWQCSERTTPKFQLQLVHRRHKASCVVDSDCDTCLIGFTAIVYS